MRRKNKLTNFRLPQETYAMEAIRTLLRLSPGQISYEGMLLVDGSGKNEIIILATALYAIRTTVHRLRANGQRCGSNMLRKM